MTGDGEMSVVSRTAVGVARIRAAETARDDRLFDDPYAERFVAAMPVAADDDPTESTDRATAARLAVHVILRTRFYDEYVLEARASGIRQIVLLAAGLDTRAFRLDWPAATQVFELDLPPVLSFKDDVLADATPRCRRVVVPADLTTDWPSALRAAGFDDRTPTAWLVEGLLIYLGDDDADRLLNDVTALSAPGSRIACERGRAMSAGATDTGVTRLWKGGLDAGVDEWLQLRGWQAHIHRLSSVAASYGRPLRAESESAFVIASR